MILDEIIEHKRTEVAERKATVPETDLRARLADLDVPRPFRRALWQRHQGERRQAIASVGSPTSPPATPNLIAEIKGRSPSRGVIRQDVDPVAVAREYELGGASCLSVLTDSRYFGGALERLALVKAEVSLPILEKDFVIDSYQLTEARAMGADCVLLIVAAMDSDTLHRLYHSARELDLDVLVESHTQTELETALNLGACLLGVNNRNLKTFAVNVETTEKLARMVPRDRVLVGESGVSTREDVERLAQAGVDAILIGEALMSAPDIQARVRELIG